jgi:hypothetical protein
VLDTIFKNKNRVLYCTAVQATDANITQGMNFTWWLTKATDTHSNYVAILLFHGKSGYTNAPLVTFICTTLSDPFHLRYIGATI